MKASLNPCSACVRMEEEEEREEEERLRGSVRRDKTTTTELMEGNPPFFCLAAARSRKFDFAAERQLRVWLSHSEGRAGIGSYLVKGLWGVWGFISTLWKTAAVYRYAKQVLNWGKAATAS